jgi:glutamate-1-semialdehyde 2,1-aminomutase
MSTNEFYAKRAKQYIPGGSHTYSKGSDQFPSNAPAVISKGDGAYIWDAQGNKFIDLGMSLGTVVLGHAYEPVLDAVKEQLSKGVNFVRPACIEGELAELLCNIIPCADMVKFGKHGSDATTAAVKLARAYTGKEYIVRCSDDAFNSVHDWFIGSTVVDRGVPKAVKDLTLVFEYNNLSSLSKLFEKYPNKIACVLFEPLSFIEPKPGFLQSVKDLCEANDALLIFDEVVSGFRFALGGAQELTGVVPHLAAFGKAMANGFSVSALVGRKNIMELSGNEHNSERVFLLSTTHGGETHAIAAAIKTIEIIRDECLIQRFDEIGKKIKQGILTAAGNANLSRYVNIGGYDCKPIFSLLDRNLNPCMKMRTLFLQETIKRGLMMPYIVPSRAHTDEIIERALVIIEQAFEIISQGLIDDNIDKLIEGEIVKPVFRKFN